MGAELLAAEALKDRRELTVGDLVQSATSPVVRGHMVFGPKTWLGEHFPNGLDVEVPAWMFVVGGGVAAAAVWALLNRLSRARTAAEVADAISPSSSSAAFSEAGETTVGVGDNQRTIPADVMANHSWLRFTLSTGEEFWQLKIPRQVYADYWGGLTTEWWVLNDGAHQARSGDIDRLLTAQAKKEGLYPPPKLTDEQKRWGHAGPPP